MNPDLELLHPYPFEKLNRLLGEVTANPELKHIALSIGEPKHESPQFVKDCLIQEMDRLANYPTTKGLPELRQTIANWLTKRFKLSQSINPESEVLPVNGTREALFAFTQAVIDRTKSGLVVTPNPFYQIYEGAAFLAGAKPHYLPCLSDNGFIPDFSAVSTETWRQCQLLFLCSPGNPTGATIPFETLKQLIDLADEHDFIIASDECYSEIYFDESTPPIGLLEACSLLGRNDYNRCLVFHSLSKRSNLPGLRSGFAAGDSKILQQFLKYRTYHGCAMPIQHQLASVAAWNDETHVQKNRDAYREKFSAVLEILGPHLEVTKPDAGFYLWPKTPGSDEEFSQQLFAQQNVTVLPGRYLGREQGGKNPGAGHVRMALVAEVDQCVEAAHRIKKFITG